MRGSVERRGCREEEEGDEHVDAGVPAEGGGCERRCASELLKNIVVHVCVGFAMF